MTIVTADSTKVEVDAAPISEVRSSSLSPFFFFFWVYRRGFMLLFEL